MIAWLPSRGDRLPADVTDFVGRHHELVQVERLLSTARLVTLTGVGGTGKTRLALRIAAELKSRYADGVWLADLASVMSPGLVVYAVAGALRLPGLGDRLESGLLVDHLRDRELLLVLDNCEHLLAACAELVDLVLRSAAGVRVLCTSRQPLGTPGEHVWRVAPLPVPEPGSPLPPELSRRYAAIALFEARAAAADPGFAVTAENAALVAEICRRLDGLPLAIELAAARLRSLSVDQLACRLSDRPWALRGRSTGPAHHRALHATFEWSFELCSAPERQLWRKLAVFVDSVELDAAEYVCANGAPLLEVISGLVDKSVLIREDVAGQVRYRLLETVREYGLSRLRAGGADEVALRRRHRDWYLRLAERFSADWFGPRQPRWSAWLLREQPNLRAALGFCLEHGDTEIALRIAACLRLYWYGCGNLPEGRYWLRRVLAAHPLPGAARARALAAQAEVLANLGEQAAAAVSAREALQLAREVADPELIALASLNLAGSALLAGQLTEAHALLDEALVGQPTGEPVTLAMAQTALAVTIFYQGDTERAAELLNQCREACRARGDVWWQASVLTALALTDLGRGDFQAAEAHLREGLTLGRQLNDVVRVARTLDLLARTSAGQGDHERAARLLGAARSVMGGARFGSTLLRNRREQLYAASGDLLGEHAFQAAYAEGAAMSLPEAIAYALETPGPQTPGPQTPGPQTPALVMPAVQLTPREWQVVELVTQGLSNKNIATKLMIAQRTAASHVEHILHKLGFKSRAQIAAWYAQHGRAAAPRAAAPQAAGPGRSARGAPVAPRSAEAARDVVLGPLD